MEPLLLRITQQAMNYAIRSGIALTTTYALQQSTRLLRGLDAQVPERAELGMLRDRLEAKIKILGPAIDLVELISARGNSSLETAVTLTKAIRWDVQNLGQQIATAASNTAGNANSKINQQPHLRAIIRNIKDLLSRIEDAVPLINLAITTSGVNLASGIPPTVSPSRLLQASTFITAGDSQYATSRSHVVQIGPTFTLTLYMLFAGHVRPETEADIRRTTWKEVIHKARVKLMRVPLVELYELPDSGPEKSATSPKQGNFISQSCVDEFAYQMLIIEDTDDGRLRTYEDDDVQPTPYGDVKAAGILELVPIHEISKIFYADTGKILNIGDDAETISPVLLLKRDTQADPPRRMLEAHDMEDYLGESFESNVTRGDAQSEIDAQLHRESSANITSPEKSARHQSQSTRRFSPGLDPEWLAFEVYMEEPESDTDSEASSPDGESRPEESSAEPVNAALSKLKLSNSSPSNPSPRKSPASKDVELNSTPNSSPHMNDSALPPIRTSLSLLETMLRLLSLQQFQQASHLSIPDELLSFFLSEATSTTGAAAGDEQQRRNLRTHARRRVGFDPYDESPIKRRGEEYQRYHGGASQEGDSRSDRELETTEDGAEEHSAGSWPARGASGWPRPFAPISFDGQSAVDEGYETQPSTQSQQRFASALVTPPPDKHRRPSREPHQSPSVRPRQHLGDGEVRYRGSPLTHFQSSEHAPVRLK